MQRRKRRVYSLVLRSLRCFLVLRLSRHSPGSVCHRLLEAWAACVRRALLEAVPVLYLRVRKRRRKSL